jgi:hypothetical protein
MTLHHVPDIMEKHARYVGYVRDRKDRTCDGIK